MLFGIVFLSHQVGSFLGVWLGGRIFDMTKSYDAMWWISIALGLVAALINWPIQERPVARLAATAAPARPAHRRQRHRDYEPGSSIMSKPTAVVVGVGAEQGVGAAVCRRFAREGYHVLVAGRTPAKIEQVVASIVAAGGSAEAVATDATREGQVVALFDRAMAPGAGREPADVVVFNAGNNQMIDFREVTAQLFEDFWRVGCFAGFLVGREAARRLVPSAAAR